ncbi:MAG: hypothetical protein LUC93_17105 [Planctomycetaceae bacterium]|nr:hypothetical protein [Planctomycetaceae bacterium]
MRRSVLLSVLLIVLVLPNADALDDIQGVTAVWNDFAASVRRGDYRRAHALFSPQSRAILPYADFVTEYGPLSAAREMVLAKPASQSTSLDGDWAQLAYGGVNPATGRGFRVVVSFARNNGRWGLVAARNEEPERVESAARGLLSMLWQNRRLAPPADLLSAMQTAQANNPALRHYRIEWDGSRFQAFPRTPRLRTFYLDESGEVRSVELVEDTALPVQEPAAMPDSPIPLPPPDDMEMPEPAAPPLVEGLPELSEPPLPGAGVNLQDELPEPPPPPGPPGRPELPRERPSLSLPDVIQ